MFRFLNGGVLGVATCARSVPTWVHSATKGGSAVAALSRRRDAAVGNAVSGKCVNLVLGLALVLAACGGSGESASDVTLPPVDESETTTTTTEAPTTTTEAVTTTEAPTTTREGLVASVSTDEVAILWANAWRVAAQSGTLPQDLEDVATPAAAEGLKLILGDGGRTIVSRPAISPPDEDGVFRIDDCLISTPPLSASPASWYSGEVAVSSDGSIRLTSLTAESSDTCVPEAVADEAITGYLEARAVEAEFFGSPDNSILSETITGTRLQFLISAGERLVAEDQSISGLSDRQWNPQVFEYTADGVLIGDCYEAGDDFGAFDNTTGERTDLIPLSLPGQRNADTSSMMLVEGVWKMSDSNGRTNLDCDLDSEDLRIPVIGVGGEQAEEEET